MRKMLDRVTKWLNIRQVTYALKVNWDQVRKVMIGHAKEQST